MRPSRSDTKILGLGAAACAVCCAGPIIGLLGGIAALGAVAALTAGAFAIAAAAGLIAVITVLRRRARRVDCEPSTVTPLPIPTRRT